MLRADGFGLALLLTSLLPGDAFNQAAFGTNAVNRRTRAARGACGITHQPISIHYDVLASGNTCRGRAVNRHRAVVADVVRPGVAAEQDVHARYVRIVVERQRRVPDESRCAMQ